MIDLVQCPQCAWYEREKMGVLARARGTRYCSLCNPRHKYRIEGNRVPAALAVEWALVWADLNTLDDLRDLWSRHV